MTENSPKTVRPFFHHPRIQISPSTPSKKLVPTNAHPNKNANSLQKHKKIHPKNHPVYESAAFFVLNPNFALPNTHFQLFFIFQLFLYFFVFSVFHYHCNACPGFGSHKCFFFLKHGHGRAMLKAVAAYRLAARGPWSFLLEGFRSFDRSCPCRTADGRNDSTVLKSWCSLHFGAVATFPLWRR